MAALAEGGVIMANFIRTESGDWVNLDNILYIEKDPDGVPTKGLRAKLKKGYYWLAIDDPKEVARIEAELSLLVSCLNVTPGELKAIRDLEGRSKLKAAIEYLQERNKRKP